MLEEDFQDEIYYHVLNRGVDKREVFLDSYDYIRFVSSLNFFNSFEPVGSLREFEKQGGRNSLRVSERLVDIIAYCLIPNHYHLLLKQISEGGISEFMKRLGGYTKYFNFKYNRSGMLFQGKNKFFNIESYFKLIETSCYINGNPEIHGICRAADWPWSSCKDYLGMRNGKLCNKAEVLKNFENVLEYKNLLQEIIRDKRNLKADLKEFG